MHRPGCAVHFVSAACAVAGVVRLAALPLALLLSIIEVGILMPTAGG